MTTSSPTIPELLIPAGNLSKLRKAVAYGADAVYVGAAGLSMRPDEASFTPDMLAKAADHIRTHNRKLYVAINMMLFEGDLSALETWMDATRDIPFDAVILSDPGALECIKEKQPNRNIHLSTQAGVANSQSALFWKKAGVHRIVLARECTLAQASQVARESYMDIEIFVHGAMCVAISGRCLLSAYLCGKSGARGECKHSCRWEWQLVEQSRPDETFPVFETGRETIFLGSTDLCLIEHIPALVQSGIQSLKVEGRMKSEYYVATVTRAYRAALDAYANNPTTYRMDPRWLAELEAISHRPYATGFAFGYPSDQPDTLQTHNQPVSTCDVLGFIENISDHIHTITVKNPFAVDEVVEWIGPGEAEGTIQIHEIHTETGKCLQKSHCGTTAQVSFADQTILPEQAILRRRIAPA